jgi:hypothetical protein
MWWAGGTHEDIVRFACAIAKRGAASSDPELARNRRRFMSMATSRVAIRLPSDRR